MLYRGVDDNVLSPWFSVGQQHIIINKNCSQVVKILTFMDINMMGAFILNISFNGVQYTLIFAGYFH